MRNHEAIDLIEMERTPEQMQEWREYCTFGTDPADFQKAEQELGRRTEMREYPEALKILIAAFASHHGFDALPRVCDMLGDIDINNDNEAWRIGYPMLVIDCPRGVKADGTPFLPIGGGIVTLGNVAHVREVTAKYHQDLTDYHRENQ